MQLPLHLLCYDLSHCWVEVRATGDLCAVIWVLLVYCLLLLTVKSSFVILLKIEFGLLLVV